MSHSHTGATCPESSIGLPQTPQSSLVKLMSVGLSDVVSHPLHYKDFLYFLSFFLFEIVMGLTSSKK